MPASSVDWAFRLRLDLGTRTWRLIPKTLYFLTDLPLSKVLEVFGEYFFKYCFAHGYDKMLATLGENIETFMQNLDALHAYLSMSYKNMKAPSFRSAFVRF